MEWWSGHIVAPALPLLGAALGIALLWAKPQWFKIWALVVFALTGLVVTVPSWMAESPLTISYFLRHLILAAGFLTILGHHPDKDTSISLCLTLLFAGLGLGVLAGQDRESSIFLCGIFGLLILAFMRYRRQEWEIPWKAISLLTVGLFSLLVSLTVSEPVRIIMLIIPLAMVWPLLPIQGVFVASVSCLPGTLPPFFAVLLPSLGFHGIINLLPVIPEGVFYLLWMIAIASALYGSLLALSQDSMDLLLAYAHMALGSIIWWYVSVTHSIEPGAVVYLGGLTLVICGLLVASQHLRARFGHLDLTISHGLAHIMPWFSMLFLLFITAAVGLPIFTLFSAFMEMMLGLSSTGAGTLIIILLTWLMASWYFPRLMQQVLFGRLSPSFKASHDLHLDERVSLILLLILLVMIGSAPSHWFLAADTAVSTAQSSFGILQDTLWKR
ncbi:MAG: proton-conducting transporter membrane subunit [Nitrospirota bacterium]|nr:proton-conducting transporter membrane subunit [Nitrospirota bacterium]